MIKLEIVGDNADDFLFNARRTLEAFGQVGSSVAVEQPPGATLSASVSEETSITEPESSPAGKVDIFPPSDDVSAAKTVDETKPRRGRPSTKKTETASEPQEVQGAEPAPDNSNPASAAPSEPVTYDIDKDLRPRVREIMAAFEKKEYATREAKKGASKDTDKTVMEASVVYCKQLFTKFGIAKISDLPADKSAAFMAESQKYLDDLTAAE